MPKAAPLGCACLSYGAASGSRFELGKNILKPPYHHHQPALTADCSSRNNTPLTTPSALHRGWAPVCCATMSAGHCQTQPNRTKAMHTSSKWWSNAPAALPNTPPAVSKQHICWPACLVVQGNRLEGGKRPDAACTPVQAQGEPNVCTGGAVPAWTAVQGS